MADVSNQRRSTSDYGVPGNHGSKSPHHGGGSHRKHSTTPKHSPSGSPRGSKGNLATLSSNLMDKIHQANLCMRRKSSPAISAEQLSRMQISSLRGSLAMAGALSSTSNSPSEMSSSGKQRTSSKQRGYSGGNPVYMDPNTGIHQNDQSTQGFLDDSRRLSSPSSLEKGMQSIIV